MKYAVASYCRQTYVQLAHPHIELIPRPEPGKPVGLDYITGLAYQTALRAQLDETIAMPGPRESVPLEEILASATGPELGPLPGITTEESEAYIKAMES